MIRSPNLRERTAAMRRRILVALPDAISLRLRSRSRSRAFPRGDVPPPVTAPEQPVRLYSAPVNYAAQAFMWARAAERLDGVGAVSMQFRGPSDLGFPADYSVSEDVFALSGSWARRQRRAVARGFSHVLIHAAYPLFGAAFDGDLEREVAWLRRRGVAVGLASLGTELRLPSRHAADDAWSPFRQPEQDWVRVLEARALRTREVFERIAAPVFVATPDLLLDWPGARWLPIVIDPRRWGVGTRPLERTRPVVLHAPTNPALKGTALIEPIMERLADEGVIEYRRIVRVPAAEMPALYSRADVVLDQFGLGIYATTSIEAMAAGRLVVAHLHDQVRDHIRAISGLDVPIVEATPDTIEEVLRDVAERTDHYRSIAASGPAFVDAVHGGRLSSEVLRSFLGVPSGRAEAGGGQ